LGKVLGVMGTDESVFRLGGTGNWCLRGVYLS
jgi:hypothetical protein